MRIRTTHDLFVYFLSDIYDLEKNLDDLLSKMANSVKEGILADVFLLHQSEPGKQIGRIEKVFELLEIKNPGKKCDALSCMIREIEDLINNIKDEHVLDFSLIAAARKIEQYKISSYDTLYVLAKNMGYEKIADILHLTLEEKKNADRYLGELAHRGISKQVRKRA